MIRIALPRLSPACAKRSALLLACALLALALCAAPAAAQESFTRSNHYQDGASSALEASRAELQQIMRDLRDLIAAFGSENTLNSKEIERYERRLAALYTALDAVNQRLSGLSSPGADPDTTGSWQPYTRFTRKVKPAGARFDGWSRSPEIDFDFESRGLLTITIDNDSYAASLEIQNAYRGDVEATTSTTDAGEVIVKVRDDDGRHEFKLLKGGLGALYVRGRFTGAELPVPHDGQTHPEDVWQPYPFVKHEVWPSGKSFKGWHDFADIELKLQKQGVILLTIDNFDYEAKWTIQDAYEGAANASYKSSEDGDVIVTVKDDQGTHQFLVQDGGLGPFYVMGRAGYRPPPGKVAH